jgi:hypothetical protein
VAEAVNGQWSNVSLLTDLEGKILLVATENEGRVWRFNADGTPDSTFPTLVKTDGLIVGLAQQTDGKLILGGAFTTVAGITRRGLAKLNVDGTVDLGFDPGFWFGEATPLEVRTFALQPNGDILAITRFIGATALLIRVHGDQRARFVSATLNQTAPGEFHAIYNAPVTSTVIIEATSTLSPPDWQRVATQFTDVPGLFRFTETNTTSFPQRFYRMLLKFPSD